MPYRFAASDRKERVIPANGVTFAPSMEKPVANISGSTARRAPSSAARSSRGVDNLSYEGIRCGMRKHKIYAYGSKDGLKMLPKPVWRKIPKTGFENYPNTLYSNLLCSLTTGKPNPPKAVFQAMSTGKSVNNFFINQD